MFENNDPNTENNESSTYRYTPERGTQSDYTAGAHNADSQYSSGPQSGYIPGSYSCSPEPPKKKKKLSAGKIIAIALACALLGGCLGVGATLLLRNNTENQTPSTGTTMYVGERQTEKVNTARTDTSEKLTPREVYAQNVNSTVGITTSITTNYWGYQTTSAASGSGFILTEDGYILTNYHVIQNSSSVQVTTYDNTSYSASIVGYDESNDIAVLKIDATGLTPVVLGSSDDLYVGDEVMAIGNPLGELTFSLTVGYVSALDREVTLSSGTTMDLIQTDAAINSGNSGGALFNSYGEVVGITNAKYSSSSSSGSASIDNIGFAIPINHVKNIITSIIEKGYIVKPYIGVSVTTVSSEMVSYGLPQGAAIKAVSENSPAAECGLKINDIITAINGEEITTSSELVKIVSASQPGDEMTLTVYRQGESEQLTLTLTVGEQQKSALADPTSSSNQQQSSGSYGGFPFGFGLFGCETLLPLGCEALGFGALFGCETLGLGLFGRAALCLPFGLRGPGGDDDAHGHQIASRGEVLRREARLGEPAAEDHLGLHAIGSGLGHGEVLGRRGLRGAAALDLDGHRAVEDGGTVFGDAGDQAIELFAVSVPRDVEHVVVGDESEGVLGRRGSGGSVRRLAEGRDCQESQRKQKGQESIHGIMDLFGLPRGQNIPGPDRGDSG